MGRYRNLSRTNTEVVRSVLRAAGAPVEPLLRRLQTLCDQAFNRVGRSGDVDREAVPRARRYTLQHVVRRILTPRRPAHPDPHTEEVLGSQRLCERLDPVVAGAPAPELDHQLLGWDLDLVVNRDDVVRRDAVLLREARVDGTGLVHEPRRRDQPHGFAADPDVVGLRRLEPDLAQTCTVALGEIVDRQPAGVVMGTGVLVAGVAEAGDEPGHRGRLALGFGCGLRGRLAVGRLLRRNLGGLRRGRLLAG